MSSKHFIVLKITIIAFIFLVCVDKINAQKITYYKDVARIIQNKCQPCHRPGEAAPFSLITYEDVAKRGSFIKKVTQSGFMPPWKPDNHYRAFKNDRSLTNEEKQTIAKWVDDKMPMGNSNQAEKNPSKVYIEGTQYNRTPDLVLKTASSFKVLGDNKERFIVFKIPFDIGAEKNVEAMEFFSSNKKVVHHANWAIHPVADDIDIKQGADFINLTEDDRTKYSQYFPFKKTMTYYGGWIPGTSIESYPNNFGWIMPKRGVILLTIHYAPSSKDEENISGVNFFFKKSPIERKVEVISLGSAGVGEKSIDPYFYIPADSIRKFELKITTPQDQSLLYIWPHMHYLGKKFISYAVTPQKDTINLVSIPSWDFRWQEIYQFKQLIKIPKGSVLTIEGTYDNTKNNPDNPSSPPRNVYSANDMKSTDEMMTMLLIFLPYKEGDEKIELK